MNTHNQAAEWNVTNSAGSGPLRRHAAGPEPGLSRAVDSPEALLDGRSAPSQKTASRPPGRWCLSPTAASFARGLSVLRGLSLLGVGAREGHRAAVGAAPPRAIEPPGRCRRLRPARTEARPSRRLRRGLGACRDLQRELGQGPVARMGHGPKDGGRGGGGGRGERG